MTDTTDTVYALAVSPTLSPTETRLYFAARESGLYRSDDGGTHWSRVSDSSDSSDAPPITTSVVLAPDFAMEPNACVLAAVPGSVLRSTDAGKSWQPGTLGAPAPLVSALAISPGFARDGTVWASTLEDGIFRSDDGGEHWSPWNFGLFDLRVLCLAVSPNYLVDKTLFAGTESGIYRSVNGGRAWREVTFPADNAPVLSLALSPSFAHDGVIFAGTEAHALFTSVDGGAAWNRTGDSAGMSPVNQILVSSDFPALPHILVQGNGALFLSRHGGQSWYREASDDFGDQQVSAVAAPDGIAPGAVILVGLTDGSIQKITLVH